MRLFLAQIFQSAAGNFSSKRTVTIASFAMMCVALIVNLSTGLVVEQFIFDGFFYIVIAGLGFTTAEPVANMMSARISKGKKIAGE